VTHLSPLAAGVRTELGPWRWTDLPAPWVLTLVALVLFVGARALYRAENARAGGWGRLFLATVRAGVLFLVLLLLAGPYREETKTAEERSELVVLVDTSASMRTVDHYDPEEERLLLDAAYPEDGAEPRPRTLTLSREQLIRRILAGDGEKLLRALDKRFVLRVFAFDEDLRSLGATREEGFEARLPGEEANDDPVARVAEAIRALPDPPEGKLTHLAVALRGVAAEHLGHGDARLAGVLLLTEGRDTGDGEGPIDALHALGAQAKDLHVVAVAVGNPKSGKNVRIGGVRAKDVVLVGDEVVVEAEVRHVGFTGVQGVTADMTITKVADENGPLSKPIPYDPGVSRDTLTTKPFTLGEPDQPQDVRLRVPFREAGTFEVKVEVHLPAAHRAEDAIPNDNSAKTEITVKDQRIKILFVDYAPRYDWRFLSNWLVREPDPAAARRAGVPEAHRRYAAQVLLQTAEPTVDLPRSGDLPPLRSFPSTRRDLFDYDVLILGDVDLRLLARTPEESGKIAQLISDFVQEGGGLALEAGVDYRDPLSFRDGPLRDLVPVVIHERDQQASERETFDVPFHLALTDAGKESPIFAVVPGKDGEPPTPDQVAEAWRRPDWTWWWLYRSMGGLRPGAVDLALVEPDRPGDRSFLDDRGRPLVAMATMPFGRGRVFFSALDQLSVLRRAQRDVVYGAFWDQVIRYLATYRLLGGNRRYKILTDKDQYLVGDSATITITALDRDFEPLDTPTLDGMHVETPDGTEMVLDDAKKPHNTLEEGGAPGTYRMVLPIRHSGTYRLWIEAPGAPGERPDRAEKRFTADYRSPELRETMPNFELLQRIAHETDGQVIRLHELPEVASDAARIPSRTVERLLGRREVQQWDRTSVLYLLVALLAVEWLLRKRSHMV
jgi:hypothetical protein